MQDTTTIGIDLAKEVFAVCMLDKTGAVVYGKVLKRDAFIVWAETLLPCTIAMEACGSAHHWGRWFALRGHHVHLIAAEFVKPFRKSVAAKNDRNDAEAIAIAARQPTMRHVAVKSMEQQSILSWHRMREGWKEERTALLNRLRGLLGEFGVWPARSSDKLIRALPGLAEEPRLPAPIRAIVIETREQLVAIHARLARCDQAIAQHVQQHQAARRIKDITGIGPLTASAALSTVGDPKSFSCGRQFAAWLGLVPRQMSSGGKARLGHISRRGDAYLRSLLVQGAKSSLQAALRNPPDKATRLQRWIVDVYGRVGYHKTLVAIANKHARMIWAMLAREEGYDPNAWQRA